METRDAPKLLRVRRMDSIRLDSNDSTYFTKEGYLVDHPILTSCGIFEYRNKDGSTRRELRLPKYVFDEKSLETYKGKPIIVTHDAGEVNKSNVRREEIGTILSAGYQDGNDVRAEIIIHDTDSMERSGLKELSLGYNLDLIEEPGVYNGQPYDAIQTNISVNHLALVRAARAGEQARLNIDGADDPELKGEKCAEKGGDMNTDGMLTPDQLKEAIDQYKAKLAGQGVEPTAPESPNETEGTKPEEQKDGETSTASSDPTEAKPEVPAPKEAEPTVPEANASAPGGGKNPEDVVAEVKAGKAERPEHADDVSEANDIINKQNIDIDKLIAALETVLATAKNDGGNNGAEACSNHDDDKSEAKDNSEGSATMNTDSIDDIIKQRLSVARVGDKLHLDGLEDLSIMDGKKKIIQKVIPTMNLDGKSDTYIDVAYDLAIGEMNKPKDVNYQRMQMMSGNPSALRADGADMKMGANAARERMINREQHKEG